MYAKVYLYSPDNEPMPSYYVIIFKTFNKENFTPRYAESEDICGDIIIVSTYIKRPL